MTKCIGDVGGRYLGNLSYGGARPSLASHGFSYLAGAIAAENLAKARRRANPADPSIPGLEAEAAEMRREHEKSRNQ